LRGWVSLNLLGAGLARIGITKARSISRSSMKHALTYSFQALITD